MAEVLEKYVGRLAPSPTGALHLGNARTFLIAWLRARSLGGKIILRMEDLDHPRDKIGADAEAINDLKWLGFDWDAYYVQSERKNIYRQALEKLHAAGKVYPCICSRRDVENAQSAPHQGEQLYYPGICRGRFKTWREANETRANPCWRFKTPQEARVEFTDVFCGPQAMDVGRTLGDFPLARDEFGAGYTLAAVVDDAAMGVTEVVRGDDLIPATPAQILLQQALNLPTPAYLHVPLAVGPDGRRLAKRHGDTRIKTYREAGWRPEKLIALLASSCNLCEENEEVSLESLIPRFKLESIPHAPWIVQNSPMPATTCRNC